VLVPQLGPERARFVSTVILCLAIAMVVLTAIRWLAPSSARQALTIGALWLSMVLAFEFGFGHFVAGKTWTEPHRGRSSRGGATAAAALSRKPHFSPASRCP
jgi:hypothetical protein